MNEVSRAMIATYPLQVIGYTYVWLCAPLAMFVIKRRKNQRRQALSTRQDGVVGYIQSGDATLGLIWFAAGLLIWPGYLFLEVVESRRFERLAPTAPHASATAPTATDPSPANGLPASSRTTEQQFDQLRKAAHFAGMEVSDEQCRGLVEDWASVGVLGPDGVVLGAFLGSQQSAALNPRPVRWFLTDTHMITIEPALAGFRVTGAVYDLAKASVRRTNDYEVMIAERGRRTRLIRLGTPTGPVFNSTPDQTGLARASELERMVREAQWALRNSTPR